MSRLGMAIDLNRCIGCQACTLACKSENATPPGVFWGRVLEKEEGKYPSATRIYLPVLCNHCSSPLCKAVCPTGATYQREDGIVLIDQEKCVGCRACITACPYHARSYIRELKYYYGDKPTPYELQGLARHQPNVVSKCDFCVHRVDLGLVPACVQTCPTNCRYFGDLDDPDSEISQYLRAEPGFQLRPEQGTDPSVLYTR